MVGWCRLDKETSDAMVISYSLGSNQNLDGEIIYSKKTKEAIISKLEVSRDEFLTKIFIGPLRSRIRKGMEVGKKYLVMTG